MRKRSPQKLFVNPGTSGRAPQKLFVNRDTPGGAISYSLSAEGLSHSRHPINALFSGAASVIRIPIAGNEAKFASLFNRLAAIDRQLRRDSGKGLATLPAGKADFVGLANEVLKRVFNGNRFATHSASAELRMTPFLKRPFVEIRVVKRVPPKPSRPAGRLEVNEISPRDE